jgi:hypothetical protein
VGRFDSSKTRVQPVFNTLYRRDPTGRTWLPALLRLFPNSGVLGPELLSAPGRIIEFRCGSEKAIPPATGFLRWLIENPDRMTWPSGPPFSPSTQEWREKLFQRGNFSARPECRDEAITAARRALDAHGVTGSRRAWWAFEGFTHVDCYIETEGLFFFVEGKRTDKLSPKTSWFPARNQLLRNLEAAQAFAAGQKPFANVMITEDMFTGIRQDEIDRGLPHFKSSERVALMKHFLGATTWCKCCNAVGIDYATLPHQV